MGKCESPANNSESISEALTDLSPYLTAAIPLRLMINPEYVLLSLGIFRLSSAYSSTFFSSGLQASALYQLSHSRWSRNSLTPEHT